MADNTLKDFSFKLPEPIFGLSHIGIPFPGISPKRTAEKFSNKPCLVPTANKPNIIENDNNKINHGKSQLFGHFWQKKDIDSSFQDSHKIALNFFIISNTYSPTELWNIFKNY